MLTKKDGYWKLTLNLHAEEKTVFKGIIKSGFRRKKRSYIYFKNPAFGRKTRNI